MHTKDPQQNVDELKKTDNDILTNDISYKATNTRQYLDFTSNHQRHTEKNIPYNSACSICTIVDDKETRYNRL